MLSMFGYVRLAKLLLKGGSSDVHTYLFAHPTQFSVPGIPGTGRGSVIVPHAAELLYVFPFGIGQGTPFGIR